MVDYLYDVIKAVAGEELQIAAIITDENGVDISEGCALVLSFGQHAEPHAKFDGTFTTCNEGSFWSFVVPAAATKGEHKLWYKIMKGEESLSFYRPLYLEG